MLGSETVSYFSDIGDWWEAVKTENEFVLALITPTIT